MVIYGLVWGHRWLITLFLWVYEILGRVVTGMLSWGDAGSAAVRILCKTDTGSWETEPEQWMRLCLCFFLMISGMECSGRSRGFSCHRAFQWPALNSFSWVVVFWADPAETFLCLFSIRAMNEEQERLTWQQIELHIQLKGSHYGKEGIEVLNVVLILSDNNLNKPLTLSFKLQHVIHFALFVL